MTTVARRIAIELCEPGARYQKGCGPTVRSWCRKHPDYQPHADAPGAYETLRAAVSRWSDVAAALAANEKRRNPGGPGLGDIEEESIDDEVGDCAAEGTEGKNARLRWCVALGRKRRAGGELVEGKGAKSIRTECRKKFGVGPSHNTIQPYIITTPETDAPLADIRNKAGAPRHMPAVVEPAMMQIVRGRRQHSLALTPWDLISHVKIAINGAEAGKLHKTKLSDGTYKWNERKLQRWRHTFLERNDMSVGVRRLLEAQRKKWCAADNFLHSQTIWEGAHVAAGIAYLNPDHDEGDPASPRVFLIKGQLWRSASFDEVHCELGTGELLLPGTLHYCTQQGAAPIAVQISISNHRLIYFDM